MADDYFGYDEEEAEPKGRDNLFLWTIFILLLMGLAFACWLGSFYIFGHPENPRAYRFLKKIKKIEAPVRFEVTQAPGGEFLSAQKLFEKYGKLTRLELERENADLLRSYIKNYRETKKLVPYITGKFVIIDSYELKSSDMFTTGVVALAQAAEFPQVLIEHICTSAPRDVPALRTLLQTGLELQIRHTNDRYDLSAIIHIERLADGRMQFTVVPLLYGTYALKQGSGSFSLEPPPELNIEPGLPIVKTQTLGEALRSYAEYRRKRPGTTEFASEPAPASAGPELARVETVAPGEPVPATGSITGPVATPPLKKGEATPRIAVAVPVLPTSTPPIALALNITPPPRAVAPPPIPVIPPPPPRVSPGGVPLQPFTIESRRDPNIGSTGATWRTYAAGRVPPARAISSSEAGALADRGELGERIYLRGEFRVTASGENRAIMRERTAAGDGSRPAESTRLIVDYPAGALPPPENSVLARDAARPFEIRDVHLGADGVMNIYVREIIAQ